MDVDQRVGRPQVHRHVATERGQRTEMDSNPPTDSLNDARCGREAGRDRIDPQPDGAAMVRRILIPRQIADPGTSVPCRFGTEESCRV